MVSTTLAKYMDKNIYDVLSLEEDVEKKVCFSPHVFDIDGDKHPLKDWDGTSQVACMYLDLLIDFMNAPRSVGMAARTNEMKIKLSGSDILDRIALMCAFQREAELTLEKISDCTVEKVPLWSKGCSYKKGSVSFSSKNSAISSQWIKLFIKSLKKL